MASLFSVYVFSLITGGFFVMMAVMGGGDHDTDGVEAISDGMDLHLDDPLEMANALHLDMDAHVDSLPDVEIAAEHVTELVVSDPGANEVVEASISFLPVFSFRFWTFGLGFFGLTGTLLSLVGIGWFLTLATAIGVGVTCGSVVTNLIRRLARQHVTSSIESRDYPGTIGRVLVEIPKGGTGKIRCQMRGQIHDVLAESDEGETLKKNQQVLIIAYQGGTAQVVHAGRLSTFIQEHNL